MSGVIFVWLRFLSLDIQHIRVACVHLCDCLNVRDHASPKHYSELFILFLILYYTTKHRKMLNVDIIRYSVVSVRSHRECSRIVCSTIFKRLKVRIVDSGLRRRWVDVYSDIDKNKIILHLHNWIVNHRLRVDFIEYLRRIFWSLRFDVTMRENFRLKWKIHWTIH